MSHTLDLKIDDRVVQSVPMPEGVDICRGAYDHELRGMTFKWVARGAEHEMHVPCAFADGSIYGMDLTPLIVAMRLSC